MQEQLEIVYQFIELIQAVGWAFVPVAGASALYAVSQYFQSKTDTNDLYNIRVEKGFKK
jgi:hypothetical protein